MKEVTLNLKDYTISIKDTDLPSGKYMTEDSNITICENSEINKAKEELLLNEIKNIDFHLEKYNNIKVKLLKNFWKKGV